MKKATALFYLSIVMMFAGAWLGHYTESGFGTIRVEHTRYLNENGAMVNAVLYVPESVSDENPAPAIVLASGYSASYDSQELHSIELARRGIVCMAIDTYGHGESGFPDLGIDKPLNDFGMYSALQYLAKLPYVDKNRLAFTGHSMGGDGSRMGSLRAFAERETNPAIAAPKAVFIQSNSFKNVNGDDPINALGIDYGDNTGRWDEFAIILWGTQKGSDYKTTANFTAGMGFEGAEYDTYYNYGSAKPLTREEAIEAGKAGTLRVGYTQNNSHSPLTFSGLAVTKLLDFFDLSLMEGKMAEAIPYDSQIWRWKNVGTGVALLGFLTFIVTFGFVLLDHPFFGTIVRKEPQSMITLDNKKAKIAYVCVYIAALAAPALLYTWTSGLRLYSPYADVVIPVMLPVTPYFNLPTLNGLVLLNSILSGYFVVLFFIIWLCFARPAGATLEGTGLFIPKKEIGKSILLSIVVFVGSYIMLSNVTYFNHVDFGFWKFVFREMPAEKWIPYMKYLPFFLLYFFINSVMLNSVTRVNGVKEWKNMLLCIFANVGGLLILWLVDYIPMYLTGIRGVLMVPGTQWPNSLSGILLFGLLFILPVAAIISRLYYRRTGNVWVSGFLNGFLTCFFGVCTALVGIIM
jgi:hypothetical protein